MRWTKEEMEYLKESYSNNPRIWEISKKLGKSIKSIHHKAVRLNLSRNNFLKIPKERELRKVIDKKYYDKNKKDIYRRKKERRNKISKELKMMLGGKCSKCGYNKCLSALDFHHNQGEKEGHLSDLIKNFSKQKSLKEIKKCILLCANCHREIHAAP